MPAVTTEHRGQISIIRINRPERLNAINQAVAAPSAHLRTKSRGFWLHLHWTPRLRTQDPGLKIRHSTLDSVFRSSLGTNARP